MAQRVLLVEDDSADAHLIKSALIRAGIDVNLLVATTRSDFLQALNTTSIDLIISDGSIPGMAVLDALRLSQQHQPQSGFIILSGSVDDKQAQQARQAGAIDWLQKNELWRLPSLVRLALERSILRTATAQANQNNGRLHTLNRAAQRLVRAVRDLSMARTVAAVQEIVRHAARELNGADGATFVLRDGQMCYYVDEDAIAPLWKGQRFPLSSCISGWAMLNQQPAVVPDITIDARIPQDAYRPTFVKSLIMVPIRTESPIGAIGNYWSTPHHATVDEIELIQALADSTSIALENVQVYQELDERVRDRTAKLQHANQALKEFSYFVSHDLRAPVRHVNAFAQILENDCGVQLNSEAKFALSKIKSAARSMNELVESLLSLAKYSQEPIRMTPIEMTALARAAAQQAREHSAKPVDIRIDPLPPTRGDVTLLRQVWINLIGNAVKYSSSRETPSIHVGCGMQQDEPYYFVRDNGVGFDMKYAQRLFSAFNRMPTSEGFPGTGVGLAIVHRIIARHGGRIWADAKPDEGASFYFTLPALDPAVNA